MSAPIRIKGQGPATAEVHDNGLLVSNLIDPPLSVPNNIRPVTGGLTIGGEPFAFDLTAVEASPTNPVDAFVRADNIGDLYMTCLSITLGGTAGNVKIKGFCDRPTGLTNGMAIYYACCAEEFVITPFATSNFDILNFSAFPGFSSQVTGSESVPFLMEDIDQFGNDAIRTTFNLVSLSPGGIRLVKGSNDTFGVRFLEDLTDLGLFYISFTGYYRI